MSDSATLQGSAGLEVVAHLCHVNNNLLVFLLFYPVSCRIKEDTESRNKLLVPWTEYGLASSIDHGSPTHIQMRCIS